MVKARNVVAAARQSSARKQAKVDRWTTIGLTFVALSSAVGAGLADERVHRGVFLTGLLVSIIALLVVRALKAHHRATADGDHSTFDAGGGGPD
jgi:hypothetical protein